jgi:hypothetical protein
MYAEDQGKGQLISKGLFVFFSSPQNERKISALVG